jgi:hypothetical protein
MQCSLVLGYQRFGGTYCLHLQVFYSEDGDGIFVRNAAHLFITGCLTLADCGLQHTRRSGVRILHNNSLQYSTKCTSCYGVFLQRNMLWVSHYTVITERKWVQSFCFILAT